MSDIKENDTKEKQLHDSILQPSTVRRIIFLDDHILFRKGLNNSCIRPFFEKIDLLEFSDGDNALVFVKSEIQMGRRIDLIITDINHPGAKGNDFVKEIRTYEALYKINCRIPIFIISMVDPSCFPDLVSSNIIDYYLSKATEPAILVNCLKRFL